MEPEGGEDAARLCQKKNFLHAVGLEGCAADLLPSDASARVYTRLKKGKNSFILMDASLSKKTLAPFMKVATLLQGAGYSVPRILEKNEQEGFLLLEDLGTLTLSSYLNQLEGAKKESLLYSVAVDVLIDLHQKEFPKTCLPNYGMDLLLQEVSLFTTWYWQEVFGKYIAQDLAKEWLSLWQDVLEPFVQTQGDYVVLRDYHVDNIMWLPERAGIKRCGLLDFQDAVLGARTYDLLSLLDDVRREVPKALEQEMIRKYLDAFPELDDNDFLDSYYVLSAQRLVKILGIFARLSLRDGKRKYLSFLPRTRALLRKNLRCQKLSAIENWLRQNKIDLA